MRLLRPNYSLPKYASHSQPVFGSHPTFAALLQMSLELPLSKEDISHHFDVFARYVQSDTQHRMFSTGQSWWSLAESKGLENILPDTVSFKEQIGITLPEMETSFGRYWK